jgi:hypothetical protein
MPEAFIQHGLLLWPLFFTGECIVSWKAYPAIISTCLGLMACGSPRADSELHRSASSNQVNNTIYRFNDGGTTKYIYANFDPKSGEELGYRLECSNILGLNRLIKATGFPVELLGSTKLLSADDEKYLALKVNAQPVLSCDNPTKTFFKSQLDGKTKYFFSDSALSKTRLHMIGCQALVDAMGFKLENATAIEPVFIDQLGLFSVTDNDDVSCLSGSDVGAGLTWMSGADESLALPPGRTVFHSYTAQKPDNTLAKLSYSTKGSCDWLLIQTINGSIVATGQTPANFYAPASCEVEVTAEKGSFYESKKMLKITGTQSVCASPLVNVGGSCVRPCDDGHLPGDEWLVDRGVYTCEADGSYGFKTISKFMRDPVSDRKGPENGITGNGVCEGSEECVYIQTANMLYWARKDWKVYASWWDAATSCQDRVYGGYSDWRLPTLAEYKAAFADKFYELNGAMFADSFSGWTQEDIDANNANIFNFQNSQITPTAKGTSIRAVFCVRQGSKGSKA